MCVCYDASIGVRVAKSKNKNSSKQPQTSGFLYKHISDCRGMMGHGRGLLLAKVGGGQAVRGWAVKQPSVSVAASCPASTDRLSLCHCNWHSNHNDGCSPGVRARGLRRSHPDTECHAERGNRQTDYMQARIRLSLHCKWLRVWMPRAGAAVEQCRDMSDDKEPRLEPRRRDGGAIYQAHWTSALPWETGFFLRSVAI